MSATARQKVSDTAAAGSCALASVGMGEHYVVAEGSQRLQSKGLPGNLIRGPGELVPAGVSHAAEAGGTSTACGLPVSGLVAFPDQPWSRGLLHRCRQCQEIVPL